MKIPTEIQINHETLITVTLAIIIIMVASFAIGYIKGRTRKLKLENQGEAKVRNILSQHCKSSTAHVLNNVTLQFKDGTTQIDHILITQNGILVIETKHYSGWIFANESDKNWTQVIFKVKYKFLNPILQNLKHLKATQQLLDFLPPDEIRGLVVFTGDAEFKTTMPGGVIHAEKLPSYINDMRLGSISENRVQFCVGRIECKRLELSEKTDIEHQEYLNRKFGDLNS